MGISGGWRGRIDDVRPEQLGVALGRARVTVAGRGLGFLRCTAAAGGARFVYGDFEETFWVEPTAAKVTFVLRTPLGSASRKLDVDECVHLRLPTPPRPPTPRLSRRTYRVPRVTLPADAIAEGDSAEAPARADESS